MSKTADLSKYLRPGKSLAKASADVSTAVQQHKQPYEAFKLSKDAKRHLQYRLKYPDPAESPLNSMITNVRGEWRRGLRITILYGRSMVVQIKGRNLQELFEAVMDWKVEWIAEFDPQEHERPTDKNAPFIESIEITTERPEDPPPMSQRH